MTTVSDVMTRNVRSLGPDDSVASAAKAMDELNVGVIPVCTGGKLLGVVTDRDIVVRSVAKGLDSNTTLLADVMSESVQTAQADDDLDDVLNQMGDSQIRRLPVVDAGGQLIGIISIGDIASKGVDDEADVGQSLGAISSPTDSERAGS